MAADALQRCERHVPMDQGFGLIPQLLARVRVVGLEVPALEEHPINAIQGFGINEVLGIHRVSVLVGEDERHTKATKMVDR